MTYAAVDILPPSPSSAPSQKSARFRPYDPCRDTMEIQAMVQGSGMSSMSFNRAAGHVVFVATNPNRQSIHTILGVTCGSVVHQDGMVMLVMGDSFLRGVWDSPCHERELQLDMMLWAHRNMGATHYKTDWFAPPTPINVQEFVPDRLPKFISEPLPEATYTAPIAAPVAEFSFTS